MPFVALLLIGALVPAPDPTSYALQVSPVSTCDDMVIGMYNPGSKPVVMTPVVQGARLPAVLVPSKRGATAAVPAQDGLYVSLVDQHGVEIGPWLWDEPADCEEIPAPAGVKDPTNTGGKTIRVTPEVPVSANSFGWVWVMLGALVLALTGLAGLVNSRRRNAKPVRHPHRPTTTWRPRHRRAPDGLGSFVLWATMRSARRTR